MSNGPGVRGVERGAVFLFLSRAVNRLAGAALWLSTQGGAIIKDALKMFNAGLCPADDLLRLSALNRQLVEARLEELRRLGVEQRDIELLFISNDYCRPDWGLAEDILDEEGKRIVREIFANAHDVARAEDELALRGRPN